MQQGSKDQTWMAICGIILFSISLLPFISYIADVIRDKPMNGWDWIFGTLTVFVLLIGSMLIGAGFEKVDA